MRWKKLHKKALPLICVLLFASPSVADPLWEKDIPRDSVYACAGRIDPSEAFGNNGVAPTFLRFTKEVLELYMPFWRGDERLYFVYLEISGRDSDGEQNSHSFYNANGTTEIKVTAYPSDESKYPAIFSVYWIPLDKKGNRVEDSEAPRSLCANIPKNIFDRPVAE